MDETLTKVLCFFNPLFSDFKVYFPRRCLATRDGKAPVNLEVNMIEAKKHFF